MTIKHGAAAFLVFAAFATLPARADDDDNDPQPCTFKAHTTLGTVSGTCYTTQMSREGYHFRWALTLNFDAASTPLGSRLKPDQFADMMRTQSVEDGTDIIILPLWGDLEVLPTIPAYLQAVQTASPLYETRPALITVSQLSNTPFTLELLFEEPQDYLNLVSRMPGLEWWDKYLKSYYRLGTNRPTGFSGDAVSNKAGH